MARPSKYKEEYCEGIMEYFRNEEIPFFEEYADSIDVHVDTLHEWASVHQEFSEAKKRAKQIQKAKWMKGGLTGDFNPTVTIWLGKCNHGMREAEAENNQSIQKVQIEVVNGKSEAD